MEIQEAQLELRRAYLRGGTGAIVAGLVWLLSAFISSVSSVHAGFAVLFFGGMLILPISSLALRLFFRRGQVSSQNPGGLTVIETIFPMMCGLLAAWLLLPYRPELVFPLAAVAVGAHYFGFRSAYGDWTNWALGGCICAVGLWAIFIGLPNPEATLYVVAGIEMCFGISMIIRSLAEDG